MYVCKEKQMFPGLYYMLGNNSLCERFQHINEKEIIALECHLVDRWVFGVVIEKLLGHTHSVWVQIHDLMIWHSAITHPRRQQAMAQGCGPVKPTCETRIEFWVLEFCLTELQVLVMYGN